MSRQNREHTNASECSKRVTAGSSCTAKNHWHYQPRPQSRRKRPLDGSSGLHTIPLSCIPSHTYNLRLCLMTSAKRGTPLTTAISSHPDLLLAPALLCNMPAPPGATHSKIPP